ncbi:uncharacterized protein LOC134246193 [Saccostrea cucullata]|uniref:uncharacterized protein LOC134246193 n=1 Tax=Saccostrea cuccullata TaxID=36930 RepID=UPI002ED224DE
MLILIFDLFWRTCVLCSEVETFICNFDWKSGLIFCIVSSSAIHIGYNWKFLKRGTLLHWLEIYQVYRDIKIKVNFKIFQGQRAVQHYEIRYYLLRYSCGNSIRSLKTDIYRRDKEMLQLQPMAGRSLKAHGRWKSEIAEDGYVKDRTEKGLFVHKTVLKSNIFFLYIFPSDVFYSNLANIVASSIFVFELFLYM